LAQKIVAIADNYTEPHVFPSTELVLAIAATESSFHHEVVSKAGAVGLMQVMPVHQADRSMESNIKTAVIVLRAYYKQLKTRDNAVMAYNVGNTAFVHGARPVRYLEKVKSNFNLLRS
jgi:soluble lytic murein transglycosylase-like protein